LNLQLERERADRADKDREWGRERAERERAAERAAERVAERAREDRLERERQAAQAKVDANRADVQLLVAFSVSACISYVVAPLARPSSARSCWCSVQ
jgi:hypothetical protein